MSFSIPKITIDTDGSVTTPANNRFVMVHGAKFHITNESSSEDRVLRFFEKEEDETPTRSFAVAAGTENREEVMDFVAAAVGQDAQEEQDPDGGVTIISVKQMSQTGSDVGLGFYQQTTAYRVMTNVGAPSISAFAQSQNANYTSPLLLYMGGGSVMFASSVNGGWQPWQSVPAGSPFTFDSALQTAALLTMTRAADGATFTLKTEEGLPVVYDPAKGITPVSSGVGTSFYFTPCAMSYF